MQKGILYLFLFTYSTVMFKPVLPFVTDFIAHLLFFKDHMETVHAHHGKLHTHATVAEGAKNDQSEKSTNNFKKDNSGTEHTITESVKSSCKVRSKEYYYFSNAACLTRDIQCDYPPPRS